MTNDIALSASEPRGLIRFWPLYDTCVALLAILMSTEAMNRSGVASPLWMLVYAGVGLRIIISIRTFTGVLGKNLAFLAYPVVCIMATVWSAAPVPTLVGGIQLMMTMIIAIWIGHTFSLRWICLANFLLISATAVLSLLNWVTGIFGQVYSAAGGLLGIYSQKNALGQRCLVALLSGVAVYQALGESRSAATYRLLVLALGVPIIIALILSKSATSMILAAPLLALQVYFGIYARSRALASSTLVLGVMAGALVPLVLVLAQFNLVDEILGFFGKSSDLTGRTDLWALAMVIVEDNWLLGVGFRAVWTAATYQNFVFLAKGIGGETALGFHNFILDILVGTGALGLLAMACLIGAALLRTVKLWFVGRDVIAAWAVLLILMSIALAFVGPSLYRQHEFSIMLVAALGTAAGRELDRLRSAARGYSA